MNNLRLRRYRLLFDSLIHPFNLRPASECLFPYSLPARSVVSTESIRLLPHRKVEELAYRFSAHGSVVPSPSGGNVHLRVSTHLMDLSKVQPFFEAFGGIISVSRAGKGGQNPSISWRLRGLPAKEAAKRMSFFSSRKEGCLQQAWQWPEGKHQQARAVKSILENSRRRKENFFLEPTVCSWRELVELMDTKASISKSRASGRVRLVVVHKNRDLLLSVEKFLRQRVSFLTNAHFAIRPTDGIWGNSFTLISHKNESVARILRAVLSHGLLLRREKARLALYAVGAKEDTVLPIHSNHSKYHRISREGVELSTLIAVLRRQIRWRLQRKRGLQRRGEEELKDVIDRLVKLRYVHRRKEKEHLLKADIRDLLRKGAVRAVATKETT